MTLDVRQRQLHDEDKSCGIQPAYIRVIYRRLSAAVLTQVHYSKGCYGKNQIYELSAIDRFNTYQEGWPQAGVVSGIKQIP